MRKLTIAVLLAVLIAAFGYAAGGQESTQESPTLRIALLPVMDSIPFFVARDKGYFEELGLTVELLPVNSPLERDQLMQAGEVDVMLNELTSAALFNRSEPLVMVVAGARRAAPGAPVFRILAAPGSGIESVADLAGVSVAVSKNSIIEYLTDRILVGEGLDADDVVTGSVPVIPERFQLLLSGNVQAATLPDPLATAAIGAGAIPVADDGTYGAWSQSVLTARAAFAADAGDTLIRFLDAWDRAAADLNADPEAFRTLIVGAIPVPAPIHETFPIPRYSRGDLPAEAEWDDAVAWLREKGLLAAGDAPRFDESVTGRYLP